MVDGGVDEVDLRRFERLEEKRRESDTYAVLDQCAPVWCDTKQDAIQVCIVLDVPEFAKLVDSLFLGREFARVNVAGAKPRQHRNLPRPAILHRDRRRVRLYSVSLIVVWDLSCNGAV